MLAVRDVSEVSRGLQRAAAVPLPSSLSSGQPGGYGPLRLGEQRGHCSAPANALPGPVVLLSKTFQGLKGKRETQKGDKRQREE